MATDTHHLSMQRDKSIDSSTGQPPPRLRFDRTEAAGALGDLGVFIPLLVGMVNRCGLQLGPALFFAGVANVITGLLFRIPMPVQPMKAIATIAIAEGMNEAQILVAGIVVGIAMLLLGVSGLIDRINQLVPKSVVRGLQLAIGLKLLIAALVMVAGTRLVFGWDSMAMGLFCILIAVSLRSSIRLPAALAIFSFGLAIQIVAQPALLSQLQFGMHWHLANLASGDAWLPGLWQTALPQIPLTLLNSVIAVCALSTDLFPRAPAQPRRVALSVALMNLVFCPFGGMPVCHGAGGLAAQYRFGARTGGSVILLGVAKILLALLFGGSLLLWLQSYPRSVLGVLLACSGLELAAVCRDQTAKSDLLVMVLTAAACIAFNPAIGFTVGWLIVVGLARSAAAERRQGGIL